MVSWERIKGHNKQIAAIRSAMAKGRLHHALMMTGLHGIGKKLVAKCTAAALMCPERGVGDFCGVCNICERIIKGTHPDVTTLKRPSGKRYIQIGDGKELKGTVIRFVRTLNEMAFLHPFEADSKVFIVDEAEWLKHEAQDAILKTLEEPPKNTHFFLLCSNQTALKDTIRSRCLILKFFPLDKQTTQEIIRNKSPETAEEDVALATAFSSGSPGRGINLLEDILFSELHWLLEWLSNLKRKNPLQLSEKMVMRVAKAIKEEKKDSEKKNDSKDKTELELIRERLIFYIQSLLTASRPGSPILGVAALPKWFEEMSDEARITCCTALFDAVTSLRENIKPQLVIDMLTTRICKYAPRREKRSSGRFQQR